MVDALAKPCTTTSRAQEAAAQQAIWATSRGPWGGDVCVHRGRGEWAAHTYVIKDSKVR